ncbi:hypothetical protein F3Y22_tig00002840pilonHSYRG00849 [Hibiscus syriacus]|uniref:DUF4283 domain-containing protein n=1 Tax=Hibiscus syriacus TaxID=106335 RepID=A0A6A3CVG2_HIBSY|nr:hypothetical protein F3Y22_tig00002840pilonHSYRG00849 [Hibiscus syriacus]
MDYSSSSPFHETPANLDATKKVRPKPPDGDSGQATEMAIDVNTPPPKANLTLQFQTEDDYVKVLEDGPWIIYDQYLTENFAMYWQSRGEVANTSHRRRFARVAVYVNLIKPLVSKVLEGCSFHAQHKPEGNVPVDSNRTDYSNVGTQPITRPNAVNNDIQNEADSDAYDPWIVVERRRYRQSQGTTKKLTQKMPQNETSHQTETQTANSSRKTKSSISRRGIDDSWQDKITVCPDKTNDSVEATIPSCTTAKLAFCGVFFLHIAAFLSAAKNTCGVMTNAAKSAAENSIAKVHGVC